MRPSRPRKAAKKAASDAASDDDGSHFSAADNSSADEKPSDDEDDHSSNKSTSSKAEDPQQPSSSSSNNYIKDQFLQIGTKIKLTSGEHAGRICTISERRVGIFLRIPVGDDIRLMQPDEIEVVEFATNTPAADDDGDDDDEKKKKEGSEKKKLDFGHGKYVGAKVMVEGAPVAGKKSKKRQRAEVKSAFSGEWYLVSDPDIEMALPRDQFEVVETEEKGKGGDEDEEDEEEDEMEEEDEDFLSSMKYCGDAMPEPPKKSLRKRRKQVYYAENEDSDDDVESWEGSDSDEEEENEEEEEEKEEEEEEEEEEETGRDKGVEFDGAGHDDDDEDFSSVEEVEKKPAPTKPVVDLTETLESREQEKVEDSKTEEDTKMTAADCFDDDKDGGDDDKKEEGDPVTRAPVILHSKEGNSNKVELLLSGMSHLPPDTKIEVFNRKTGQVMKGDEAIALKDLPAALLNHAEYEPIVPPPQSVREEDAETTEAVAKTTLPIDPNFDPYDNSILVGVTAVVKHGCYKGMSGKIIEVQERGRWVIDHEAITTTVRSSDCHFIDDGKVDKNAIAAHYGTKKHTQMPSFVKPGTVKAGGNKTKSQRVRRVGRTDTNVRVSNVVVPQTLPRTRVRVSAVGGKRVLVTGGEYSGLSGTISSCIPGGWYLVSKLYDDPHALDVLIHSKNLELINNERPKKGKGSHSKAAESPMEKNRKDDNI